MRLSADDALKQRVEEEPATAYNRELAVDTTDASARA